MQATGPFIVTDLCIKVEGPTKCTSIMHCRLDVHQFQPMNVGGMFTVAMNSFIMESSNGICSGHGFQSRSGTVQQLAICSPKRGRAS